MTRKPTQGPFINWSTYVQKVSAPPWFRVRGRQKHRFGCIFYKHMSAKPWFCTQLCAEPRFLRHAPRPPQGGSKSRQEGQETPKVDFWTPPKGAKRSPSKLQERQNTVIYEVSWIRASKKHRKIRGFGFPALPKPWFGYSFRRRASAKPIRLSPRVLKTP